MRVGAQFVSETEMGPLPYSVFLSLFEGMALRICLALKLLKHLSWYQAPSRNSHGGCVGVGGGGVGCYLSVHNSPWQLLPHMSRGAGEGRGKGAEPHLPTWAKSAVKVL